MRGLRDYALLGLLSLLWGNIVPWTLTAWAAQTIDSGLVAVLNSTSPIFAFFITRAITRHVVGVAAGIVFLGETLTPERLAPSCSSSPAWSR